MVLAAFYSSITTVVLAISIASWVLFWGTLSAAILAIWRRPNLHGLWMGLAGPIGPLIAVGLGLTRPRQPDESAPVAELEVPPSTGPRAVP